MSDSRHIVIVGGGIIGTSIAYYLSRTKGAPAITLLESSKGVAPGASGKAGGFLALDWHGMATSSLAALSYKLHRDLAKENNGAERWGYREVEVRFYFILDILLHRRTNSHSTPRASRARAPRSTG